LPKTRSQLNEPRGKSIEGRYCCVVRRTLEGGEKVRASGMFKGCRLARMSDGHYCLLRNLGLVKGGNGMKHHEVVIDFSRRGMMELFRRLIDRNTPPDRPLDHDYRG
jgi:hypothetical protein